MLVEQKQEIFDYIKDVENLMDRRFQGTDQRQTDFPSGWWICCIKNFYG